MQPTELTPSRRAVRALAAAALLAVATPWPAAAVVDFTFTTPNAIKVGPTGFEYIKVDCVLSNTGTEADEYDIVRPNQSVPTGWTTSICIGGNDGFLTNGLPGGCQAPFVDSLYANTPPCGFPSCGGPTDFGLNPGQNDTISCYVTPSGGEGSGYATFIVRSNVNSAVARTLILGAVSDGVQILIMDDDGGPDPRDLLSGGHPGHHPQRHLEARPRCRERRGARKLPVRRLVHGETRSPASMRTTARRSPRISRAAASSFSPARTWRSIFATRRARTSPWPTSPGTKTNLKTRYVSNNSNSTNITGIAGDPISNGLNLAIQGGTGANNQTDPDVLRPIAGSGSVWTYGAGNLVAATKVRNQGNRAVNLGFGFEAIANAGDRQTVMQRMIEWLGASPVGIEETEVAAMPAAIEIEPARPNPFNPATTLAFRLRAAGEVELRIVDMQGHVVRVLDSGMRSAGHHEVFWDGRDARGREVASGVYIAEVVAAGGRRRSHEADARPLISHSRVSTGNERNYSEDDELMMRRSIVWQMGGRLGAGPRFGARTGRRLGRPGRRQNG